MQIALQLGISRDTVRRYQRMSAAEVNDRLHKEFQRRRRKLDAYEEFIKNQLQSRIALGVKQMSYVSWQESSDFGNKLACYA